MGVYVTSGASNNNFYHNNFINNAQHAYDDTPSDEFPLCPCQNNWDNGYPEGGNYWDDYSGSDSDSDGIGDTPYSIPGGCEDEYPLMAII